MVSRRQFLWRFAGGSGATWSPPYLSRLLDAIKRNDNTKFLLSLADKYSADINYEPPELKKIPDRKRKTEQLARIVGKFISRTVYPFPPQKVDVSDKRLINSGGARFLKGHETADGQHEIIISDSLWEDPYFSAFYSHELFHFAAHDNDTTDKIHHQINSRQPVPLWLERKLYDYLVVPRLDGQSLIGSAVVEGIARRAEEYAADVLTRETCDESHRMMTSYTVLSDLLPVCVYLAGDVPHNLRYFANRLDKAYVFSMQNNYIDPHSLGTAVVSLLGELYGRGIYRRLFNGDISDLDRFIGRR